jgi:hypothetical protein
MLRIMENRVKHLIDRALSILAMLAVLAWPAIAAAQAAAPPPALRRTPPVWLGLMIMALLLAMVLAVSLMPSKRSHQD